MLYDDANQVEVRYVISLSHHNVSIYGGERGIPEGELWIKRNAICLSRRLDSLADLGGPTPPFYLFSENLSEKEDFYFAMLQNQAKMGYSSNTPPKSQQFDVKHIIALVQRLHSSEQQLQTRWLNAVLGRLFLALYKTPQMEEYVRSKITKKISRVKKPNFVNNLGLQRIDMGEGAPFITNPRLKDLTVDGNCCIEADLQYTGNFRVELSATVRIDLGARFKPREVDLVLAVVLKKFEGHGLLRFKPPPSNRVWISFESMPQVEMDIEPIVSSKQITLGIVLRAIESRIREVIAESIVLPFWDDIPFLDTGSQSVRGGIWEPEAPEQKAESNNTEGQTAQHTFLNDTKQDDSEIANAPKAKEDRASTVPLVSGSSPTTLKSRQSSKSSIRDLQTNPSASSSAVDKSGNVQLSPTMRSRTYSITADPVVTADNVKVDKTTGDPKKSERSSATSTMIEISNRSQHASPSNKTPNGSLATDSPLATASAPLSSQSSNAESVKSAVDTNNDPVSRPLSSHDRADLEDLESGSSSINANAKPRRRSTQDNMTRTAGSSTSEEKSLGSISLGTATAMAKKWGLTMFGKGEQNSNNLNHNSNRSTQEGSKQAGTPENPIGRGHPFPPPGTPLPTPAKFSFNKNTLPRRKPVQSQVQPEQPKEEGDGTTASKQSPPRRKPVANLEKSDRHPDELLVVEAPCESNPNIPATENGNVMDNTEQIPPDDMSTVAENRFDKGDRLDGLDDKVETGHDPQERVPKPADDEADLPGLANDPAAAPAS